MKSCEIWAQAIAAVPCLQMIKVVSVWHKNKFFDEGPQRLVDEVRSYR